MSPKIISDINSLLARFKFNKLVSLQLYQLLRYGSFLLISICLARLRLPQSQIGQYETFLLLSGMVSFFWVSGIINSMLAIFPKKNTREKKAILFNTFITLFAFSLIAGASLFLFSDNLLSFLDRENGKTIVKLSVVYLVFNNPSFLIEYILFLNERKKAILIYGLITGIATLTAAVTPVILHQPLVYSMYGLIAVAVARLLLAFILLSKFGSFKPDFTLLRQHLQISTPIILSLFVSGSSEYIDGIIVKSKFNDPWSFAIYRYGAKELPVLLIIANTFSAAMIPSLSINLNKGLDELKEKSAKLMHIFFPVTIVLLLISPYLYKYVFNDSFIYSALIFNIYLLLIVPRVLFPQTILTALYRTKFLLISSIFEIIINVSLSVYLAGKIGLPGVAMGTLIAYTFDKLFLLCIAHFALGISPARFLKVTPYLVYIALSFVAFGVGIVILHHI